MNECLIINYCERERYVAIYEKVHLKPLCCCLFEKRNDETNEE